MSVVVLVPYAEGEGRARLLRYVQGRLCDDGWPVVVGRGVAGRDGWCKAAAVAEALQAAAGRPDDVVVVHDADVLVDLRALRQAVDAVEAGAGWAIPHYQVLRLDQLTTDVVLAGHPLPARHGLTRAAYVGVAGGGCVVMTRAVYEDCPLDHRFFGWGDEDLCWGWALSTLHGGPWRSTDDLVHLWHPHAEPGAQRAVRRESGTVRRHYRSARHSPERMRAVIAAGR